MCAKKVKDNSSDVYINDIGKKKFLKKKDYLIELIK